MSSKSEQERERLKQEYKEHYRKIRDVKEKLRRNRSVQNISNALENMDTSDLMDSVDHFLGKVRHKVADFEARLDVALENLTSDDRNTEIQRDELDEELRKEKARETLKQVKLEMGMLYNDLEKRAGSIQVEKTIGRSTDQSEQNKPESKSENKEGDEKEG